MIGQERVGIDMAMGDKFNNLVECTKKALNSAFELGVEFQQDCEALNKKELKQIYSGTVTGSLSVTSMKLGDQLTWKITRCLDNGEFEDVSGKIYPSISLAINEINKMKQEQAA